MIFLLDLLFYSSVLVGAVAFSCPVSLQLCPSCTNDSLALSGSCNATCASGVWPLPGQQAAATDKALQQQEQLLYLSFMAQDLSQVDEWGDVILRIFFQASVSPGGSSCLVYVTWHLEVSARLTF